MPHLTTILLGAAMLLCMSPAAAQNAPPTFRADPSVYKLLYEDQNIRVISATWAKGVHDKPHSQLLPSVAHALDDCTLRLYAPDGKTRDITSKAGSEMEVPIAPLADFDRGDQRAWRGHRPDRRARRAAGRGGA